MPSRCGFLAIRQPKAGAPQQNSLGMRLKFGLPLVIGCVADLQKVSVA